MSHQIRSLTPIQDAARPVDHVWQWPRAFVATGIQRMVDQGHLSEAQAGDTHRAYERFESTPHAFQLTPTVLEIIAIRR